MNENIKQFLKKTYAFGAIYIRVSMQEQARKELSVDMQQKVLRTYADDHNWMIYKVYIDAGYSGLNEKRPAYQQLMQDVKLQKFKYVLVYKLDRLHKNLLNLLSSLKEMLKHGVFFVSATQEIANTSTASGMFMLKVMDTFAGFEKSLAVERVRAMWNSKEKKKEIYVTAPLGYSFVKNENGKIIAVPNEKAYFVQKLFLAKLKHRPVRKIAKAARMTSSGLYDIYHNPFYMGYVRFRNKLYHMPHKKLISKKNWLKLVSSNQKMWDKATIVPLSAKTN